MDGSTPIVLDPEFWDAPPDPADLCGSISRRIMQMANAARLSPMQQLLFQGVARRIDRSLEVRDLAVTALGSSRVPPLEFMRFQAKNPIDEWQYLAGVLFRSDWEAAHRTSSMTANYDAGEMYDVDGLAEQRASYTGRGARRSGGRGGTVPVQRLDAMARLGAFLDRHDLSFFLARKIIAEEFSVGSVATAMGEDERYVGPRFREALIDLALHYGLMARGKSKGKIRGVMDEKPIAMPADYYSEQSAA